MGELKSFADRHSQFISFDDEGIIEGYFAGAKVIVKESFGEEKEVVRYKINDKVFDSISGNLALQMDIIPLGAKIRITRTGEGMKTRYKVETLQ